MTPAATLVHHIAGRTRFRVSAKQGDGGYFAGVSDQLGQCPGVMSVITNELTGSVVVLHEAAEPDVLVAYARTFDLFDVPDSATGTVETIPPPADILTHRLGQMDHWVRTATGQSTDLRSVALTGLVGAALWQMLRGRVFPAAATLIWYALFVASYGRRGPGGGHEQQESKSAGYEEVDSSAE